LTEHLPLPDEPEIKKYCIRRKIMNSLERINNILADKPVDRLPITPILMQFAAKFINKPFSRYLLNYKTLVESHLRCHERFGFDMMMTLSDAYRETFDFGANIEFPYDSLPLSKEPFINSFEDIKKLKIINSLNSTRMWDRIRAVELYKKEVGDEIAILGWVEGALAEITDLRGMGNIMIDLYENMNFIKDMVDIVIEVEKQFALEQIKVGAHFIGIGDAACSLIAPEMYKEYFMLKEKELVDFIHLNGAKVKLHICGNTTNHVKYMVETGADIIDIDWMVPVKESIQYLKKGQVLCGNPDPVSIIMNGTKEKIVETSKKCVKDGDGRLILSAGCEITRDTPHENFETFCNIWRLT
jgi:MtaA/CmuA family methyltransferase